MRLPEAAVLSLSESSECDLTVLAVVVVSFGVMGRVLDAAVAVDSPVRDAFVEPGAACGDATTVK
jgi:hypothetical protein